MANSVDKVIVEEGWRNATVRYVGVLDVSDEVITPAIALTDFSNNDDRAGTLVGFRVDEIEFSISEGMGILLYWNSNVPKLITALQGTGEICFKKQGGLQPDQALPGYDGNINLVTNGQGSIISGQGATPMFTLKIKLVKLYA